MRSDEKRFVWFVLSSLVVAALLLVIGLATRGGEGKAGQDGEPLGLSFTIEIGREHLQAKVDKQFPRQQEGALGLSLVLRDPKVTLDPESDRVGLQLVAAVKQPGIKVKGFQLLEPSEVLTGQATVSGRVRYEPGEGAVYLYDPAVSELKIEKLPEKGLGPVRGMIEDQLRADWAKQPIHTFQARNMQEIAAKLLLKSIAIQNGLLIIEVGF